MPGLGCMSTRIKEAQQRRPIGYQEAVSFLPLAIQTRVAPGSSTHCLLGIAEWWCFSTCDRRRRVIFFCWHSRRDESTAGRM